jgi:hypothetical protein
LQFKQAVAGSKSPLHWHVTVLLAAGLQLTALPLHGVAHDVHVNGLNLLAKLPVLHCVHPTPVLPSGQETSTFTLE